MNKGDTMEIRQIEPQQWKLLGLIKKGSHLLWVNQEKSILINGTFYEFGRIWRIDLNGQTIYRGFIPDLDFAKSFFKAFIWGEDNERKEFFFDKLIENNKSIENK